MSLCRALWQRSRSFSSSIATLRNAHTLNGTKSESASRSSYPSIDASHRGYGFRAAVPDGSHHAASSNLRGCGHSPYASGLRAMHWIASTNYQQLGYNRDSIMNVKDCRLLAVRGPRPRFYSGGPVFWTLLGANVAVHLMWSRISPRFMDKHFLVSVESLASGRFHTLVTSAFSHASVNHLLWNMVGLFCFGSLIERMFGGDTLLALYLLGGIYGSLGHVCYYAFFYPRIKKIPLKSYNVFNTPAALGASGAVTSLTLLFILLHPTHTMFLMFIPMPAAMAGCIIVGRDVYLAIRGGGTVSVGAHLGGALCGVMYYVLKLLQQ